MALIDIVKLNKALDEMIARQDAEVDRIKAEIYETKEKRYDWFASEMRKYAEVVSNLNPNNLICVFVGCYKTGYGDNRCYSIAFGNNANRYYFGHDTTLGDFNKFSIRFIAKYKDFIQYGGYSVLDDIALWYEKNPEEFERRFEEACVKAIKAKAEKANARYDEAKKKYEEVCS